MLTCTVICNRGFRPPQSPISRATRAHPRDLTPLLSSNYKRLIAHHPYFHAVTSAWGYGAAGYLFERFVFQLHLRWTRSKHLPPTAHGAILLPAYWRLEISPRPMERQGLPKLAPCEVAGHQEVA
jgi:hypothetical protein